ncbi:MAG TPA: hypothetical protein VFD43_09775 [Planctomycetota bacterium]|nr:hypothetical protein [Planctomycetota bacterium]
MLVDTGAACTMVDDRTPVALGHKPVRLASIGGATGRPESRPVYLMELTLRFTDGAGTSHHVTMDQEVVGLEPQPQRAPGFGLLGRDCLARMRFIYDGPLGAFSLILAARPPG